MIDAIVRDIEIVQSFEDTETTKYWMKLEPHVPLISQDEVSQRVSQLTSAKINFRDDGTIEVTL